MEVVGQGEKVEIFIIIFFYFEGGPKSFEVFWHREGNAQEFAWERREEL